MGVSYGGFVALEFARLASHRLHTLTLSGILLSHERTFELYQAISLRFYAGGPALFPLYTHYLYEKIFGEAFVVAMKANLPVLRARFPTTATRTRHTPSSASPSRRTRSSQLSTRTSRATRPFRGPVLDRPGGRGPGRFRPGSPEAPRRLPRRAVGADRGIRARRLPREARRVLRGAPQVPGGEVDDVLTAGGAPDGRRERRAGECERMGGA